MTGITSIAIWRPLIAGLAEIAWLISREFFGCLSGRYVVLLDFFIDGDFVDGDFVDGDFVDGDFVDGDFVDGDFVDGDFVDGFICFVVVVVVQDFVTSFLKCFLKSIQFFLGSLHLGVHILFV